MQKDKQNKTKIIIIVGPTASGKTGLGIRLAKKFNGEIISADSRQVYKGLNIGTGKVTKTEAGRIPHHLIDVINPKNIFTVVDFKSQAEKKIKKITKLGKIPIIVGGTGFYIKAIVHNIVFPTTPINKALRKKLEKKSVKELHEYLKKQDPGRAYTIDPKNKRRIIRAIEIVEKIGKVPKVKFKHNKYDVLQIGIVTPDKILKSQIFDRLLYRIQIGMVAEVKQLHKKGLSWKRMRELGLQYRYISLHLQNKLSKEEMIEKLNNEIWHYAKRQKTWFKKNKDIKWYSIKQINEIKKEIENFLK